MSYFLFKGEAQVGREIDLDSEEARHIVKSRRHIVGDKIEIQDSLGKRHLAQITLIVTTVTVGVKVRVLREIKITDDSRLNTILCQALVKEKALDNILQKTTELGVSKIIIFNSEHTPDKLPKEIPGKLSRWKKIASEATKQCGRTKVPEIIWCDKFDSAIAETKLIENKIVLNQGAGKTLVKVLPALRANEADMSSISEITLFVGPEGGWSEKEMEKFKSLSFILCSMGPGTLRADTAAISGLVIVQSVLGDLG